MSTTEVVRPIQTTPASSRATLEAPKPSPQIPALEQDRPLLTDGTPHDPSDEELTALARNGNIQAFDKLIQRHRNMCMRRAMMMMRNRSDAEDEVQGACRRAFQHLDQFQGKGTFAGWLGRIVENQCLMRIREERNAHFVYLDNRTEANVRLELVSQTSSPEDELGREEVAQLLRKEMSRLPALFRNIMLLCDSEQLPMPDVAQRLGLSVPAAKSRLLRARRELRSRIGKHCGPKGPATLLEKATHRQTAYARAS
jgi:RNA polymerase sigma-70 factor (ECF subfamily)